MASAKVNIKEIDLSTRVPSFPGVYAGIVIPAKKGPVNVPYLVTSDTQLLEQFTPDARIEVGYDLSYFSALAALQRTDKMWVVRAAKQAKYAGASVKAISASTNNQTKPSSPGITDPTAYLFDTEDDVVATAEVTEFTAIADVLGAIGGKYFTWSKAGPVAPFYAWYRVSVPAVAEVTTITCVADVASSLNNKYFFLNTSLGPNYYVWYNVGGAGVDPAIGGRTGIEVAITANSTAAAVATATRAAIAAVSAQFGATLTGPTVTVTNVVSGSTSDAVDVDTTFTINVVTQGANATTIGTDPALVGATGVMISIAQNATASQVAADTVTTLGAHGAAAVPGQPTKFRITNANVGLVPDSTAGNSGFAILIVTQGADTVNNIDECLLIHAANQGHWGNDVAFKLTTYISNPDKVKEPDAFLIEVFKSSNLATPLESWLCSRKQGKKDGFGRNIYVVDVLESSNYIRARDNVAVLDNVYPKDQVTPLLLGGGNDGLAVTDSEMITAALTLANKDELLLTVLMDGGFATPAYQQALDGIASSRQDCVALLSVPYSAEASASYMTDIIDYRKTTLNLNSSYSALYTSHVKIYDRFNDRSLYVSPEGYAAAVISYSATNQEIWFPPAGYRRGIIQVLDVRRKFTRGEMDALYDSGINPIRFAPGKGIAVWGQKTLLSRPSSLDRLNVRLLLCVIEPAIAAALEDFLFEFNDEPTRSLATSIVDSYMVDIQARRGVQDFRVVCNSTNNTAVDIDNNRLNMDVFIKPNRSAEEINLRMVLTATSISFELAAQLI